MNVWTRLLAPLPVLLAALTLGGVSGARGLVAVVMLPALLSWPSRRRVALAIPAQVLLLIGCGMIGLVLASLLPAEPGLGSNVLKPAWAQLALSALLFAGVRLHLEAPVWGLSGTYGAGVLVLIACGTVQSGDFFPAMLIVYAGLAFAARSANASAHEGRRAATRFDRRHTVATGLLLLVAGGMTLALADAIPRFHAAAYDLALRYIDERHQAGFHDGAMQLGSFDGLLQSREVVMRVVGDAGDLLRGNVYTHYSRGRWLPTAHRSETDRLWMSIADAREGDLAIRADVWLVDGRHDRFFLPSVPGRLALSPARIRVDELGVVRTDESEPAERLLVLATDDRPFVPAEPRPADIGLTDELRDELAPLVSQWTRGAETDSERLAALRARLEGHYTYSLQISDRGIETGRDPILTFLMDDRKGHCEYFASAITLLARASGMPARLITGYRVSEHNPLGDYAIVRERHAHAWSEVHLAGRGWVSVDPSPLRGVALAGLDVTPIWPGLIDFAALQWHTRGPELLLIVLVVGLASVQVVRLVRGRRPPLRRAPAATRPPPGWLKTLLRHLSERGHGRFASEPIETLARRVQAAEIVDVDDGAPLGEAAALLRRYAANRYGGEGDVERLRHDVERWVHRDARLASARVSRPGSSL